MRVLHGAASHVGLVRGQNEDSYVVGGGIYAVCDGMGGARAGEVASELACAALVELTPYRSGPEELQEAVQKANTTVWRRGHDDPALTGMGTTMTAALVRGDTLIVAHVGDSRAYRWRAGALDQLTDDHSLVGEMVRQGQLTPAQAEVHPHRSIITKALGTDRVVEPDTFFVTLEPGDRVLLCTDGLSGMVPAPEIAAALESSEDPQAMADALVAAALAHGGEDNVTVVVMAAVEDDVEGAGSLSDTVVGPDDLLVDRPQVGPLERLPDTPEGTAAARGLRRLRAFGARAMGPEGAEGPEGAVGMGAEERADRGRRTRWILIGAGVVAAALVLIAIAVAAFNSTVYFVGTSNDGRVALFQGLPYAPFGLAMYSVVEVSPMALESLQPYLRERVQAEDLVSKEQGLLFIRGLEDSAVPDSAGEAGPSASPTTTGSTTSVPPVQTTVPATGAGSTLPTAPAQPTTPSSG